jgi:6-phosphogluconolactonase
MRKLMLFICCLSYLSAHSQTSLMFVGTYTDGKSHGIYVYEFNNQTGVSKIIDSIKSANPSYLAISPNKKYVFAVNENGANENGGSIVAYGIDKNLGKLTYLNQQKTLGNYPCYTATDNTGKWLAVGNYGGSIAIFPIAENGMLGNVSSFTTHTGSSINIQRQTAAHVHCTYFSANNKKLYVPDLGIDKVMIYDFDSEQGKINSSKQAFVQSQLGAGPRHFILTKNNKFSYLIQELTGTIQVCKKGSDTLKQIQVIAIAADTTNRFAGSADIHLSPDEKFLYCSNRGDYNTISIFKVDKKTGLLNRIDTISTMGVKPRNFNITSNGKFLLVANQFSSTIIILKRDKKTGLLIDTGNKIEVPNPVCIKFIDK